MDLTQLNPVAQAKAMVKLTMGSAPEPVAPVNPDAVRKRKSRAKSGAASTYVRRLAPIVNPREPGMAEPRTYTNNTTGVALSGLHCEPVPIRAGSTAFKNIPSRGFST